MRLLNYNKKSKKYKHITYVERTIIEKNVRTAATAYIIAKHYENISTQSLIDSQETKFIGSSLIRRK